MKNTILTFVMMFCSIMTFAQEEKSLGVFESDTTWLEEIIKFPIGFAPEIKYEGYEDLRFAKQWRNKSHDDFWCYTFAWHINGSEKQSAEILEVNLKSYYDGLMKAVNKKKDFEVPETTVLCIQVDGKDFDYTGKIYVYDSFTLEDMITLNVRIKIYQCDNKPSSTVVFRLSPKSFTHNTWERFNEIKLKADFCD